MANQNMYTDMEDLIPVNVDQLEHRMFFRGAASALAFNIFRTRLLEKNGGTPGNKLQYCTL